VKRLTGFDVLVSDVSGCLNASGVDDVGKLLALSLVAVAAAQHAPNGETRAVCRARDALGDAAARYAGAALGIHVKPRSSSGHERGER